MSVLFGNEYNIRMTVASSGHDFFGRSSCVQNLHLNMKKMKSITIDRSNTDSPTGISASMGPGVITVKAYKDVSDQILNQLNVFTLFLEKCKI